MLLITNKFRLLMYTIIALGITGISGLCFLLIEKEPPIHHTPFQCTYSFGDVTVERCENDETICYRNAYANQGGISCHWKTANDEFVAKPDDKEMKCEFYSGSNELSRCENSEIICYTAKGGASCKFKNGQPRKQINHLASTCEYYSGSSEFYRCSNDEAICYGSQKGGISCKIQ